MLVALIVFRKPGADYEQPRRYIQEVRGLGWYSRKSRCGFYESIY